MIDQFDPKERMMKRTISVLLAQSVAATLLLGCGLFAMAQDDIRIKAKVDANADQREGGKREVVKLSRILKSKVLIQQDQPAGTVVDVVLSDGGCVEYVVAMHEDQYYVVPYTAGRYRAADQVFFVDIAPAQFQKVTYFSQDRWPDFYAPAYRNQVYSFYGVDAPRAGVNVDGGIRNRANNDSNTDPAAPGTTRKTLKPDLQEKPTTPDVKKPKLPGDQPVQPQPKEVNPRTPNKDINPRTPSTDVNPRTPDKKPDVPTPNPVPKEVPKPKLPQ